MYLDKNETPNFNLELSPFGENGPLYDLVIIPKHISVSTYRPIASRYKIMCFLNMKEKEGRESNKPHEKIELVIL